MPLETRTATTPIELRADRERRIIEGHIPHDTPSKPMGGIVEVIRPTAFRRTIDSAAEVLAYVGHDSGKIVGRRSRGTLELELKASGLYYRIHAPQTTVGEDLIENVDRGDIPYTSFGFLVRSSDGHRYTERDDGLLLRELLDVDLHHVAPEPDPAYPDATVVLRHLVDLCQADPETMAPVALRAVELAGDNAPLELRRLAESITTNQPPENRTDEQEPTSGPTISTEQELDSMRRRLEEAYALTLTE